MHLGKWTSSDPEIVEIDPLTGVAKVVAVKSGSVEINHSLHPASSIHLQLVGVERLIAYPPSSGYVTNGGAKKISVPVILTDDITSNKSKNIVSYQ